jgi:excisionase family DNA binding protein
MRNHDPFVDEDATTGVFVPPSSSRRSAPHRDGRDILTVKEAAALLRVNVKTVHAMLADGLPHLRPSPRVIRIERAVLTSWHKVA